MAISERICSIDDVANGEARRFDLGAIWVAIVRIDDHWYAIGDRCTHENASLAEGEVHAESLEFGCAKCGSRFSLTTGEPTSLPATRPTPTYDVRIDDADVYLEL